MTIYAPARNYEGKVEVKIVAICYDTRGVPMWRVEALQGFPWDEAGMHGWSPTNTRKVYPEQLETTPAPTEADSIIKLF